MIIHFSDTTKISTTEGTIWDYPISKDIGVSYQHLHGRGPRPEAQFAKAMDKLEVLIQHNEADISTWDVREWDFNLVCANEYVTFSNMLQELRELLRTETKEKIAKARKIA